MSTSGNDIRGRKISLAGVFSRAALTYDRVGPKFFSHFGTRLVELSDLKPGMKILDAATGRGAVLFPALEKVGPQGYVTGIDLAGGMVAHTATELLLRHISNGRVTEMDAEYMNDFQDSTFDAVLCGFGVFFFTDIRRGLQEFYRILKPGAFLAATSWGPLDERWNWLSEVGLRPARRETSPESTANRPPNHHDGNWWKYLETLLAETGFVNHRIIYEEKAFSFASPEQWWESEWSHGARAFLEKLDFESLERAKAAAFERLEDLRQKEGQIEHLYRVYYSFAQKPLL